MALVDVLDFIPKHEAGRDSLLAILDNVAVQVKKLQDPETGGWYQVMDRSGDKGNYLESSCSAMFIYSLFKAVRMGYIDPSYPVSYTHLNLSCWVYFVPKGKTGKRVLANLS